jgi:hypothetical protein
LAMACCMLFLVACGDEEMGQGNAEFEITDAPIDDASVDAVMVTVADVKVNGTSISGFTKQTINLKAYQEGNTKLLATALKLDAKSYSKLTLVLDLDHDVNGDAPGCYVRTTDATKYKLSSTASGTMDVVLTKTWKVQNNTTNKIVLDFDLRKSIVYSDNAEARYRFVNEDNLQSSIRVVEKSNTGTIKGSYMETESTNADEVIVYAYKKGTFSFSHEMQPQGEDGMLFSNAVASAQVKESLTGKTFTLALLEAGEYELRFASYNENASGQMEFSAMHQSEIKQNDSVISSITLHGEVTTNISTNITGLF